MTKTLLVDCDSPTYFEMPEVSNSAMNTFRREGSWSYYHKHVLRDVDSGISSDAMRKGSAFHAYMEFFHTADDDSDIDHFITVIPEEIDGEPLNMRKKAHREYVATYKDQPQPWVTHEEFMGLGQMVAAIHDNPLAFSLLAKRGQSEVVATNNITGVDCKAKADLYYPDDGVLIDFKTTRVHDPEQFARESVYKYGYHHQAAHYLDVFEARKFYIIATRNSEPFEAQAFEFSKEVLDTARLDNEAVLKKIATCTTFDSWHTTGWDSVTLINTGA